MQFWNTGIKLCFNDMKCSSCSFFCGFVAFGVPNRRRRVFLLASMHGDARDVLLAQVQCEISIIF